MTARVTTLKTVGWLGAVVGYGFLAVFLALVSYQFTLWFRDGEWTHIGLGDFLSTGFTHCCASRAESAGAHFVSWFDSPDTWLGLHRTLELMPASFALFALSILGNSLFIYCRDRLRAP